MDNIEKEFFEAFSIKKVRECELRNECFLGFAHTCHECDIYGQAYEVYPPITPEIVLKLEEIIIDKYFNLILNKAKDDYPYQYETKDLFTDWCKTKKEALLSLCIGYKDEIEDQVRNLFNG